MKLQTDGVCWRAAHFRGDTAGQRGLGLGAVASERRSLSGPRRWNVSDWRFLWLKRIAGSPHLVETEGSAPLARPRPSKAPLEVWNRCECARDGKDGGGLWTWRGGSCQRGVRTRCIRCTKKSVMQPIWPHAGRGQVVSDSHHTPGVGHEATQAPAGSAWCTANLCSPPRSVRLTPDRAARGSCGVILARVAELRRHIGAKSACKVQTIPHKLCHWVDVSTSSEAPAGGDVHLADHATHVGPWWHISRLWLCPWAGLSSTETLLLDGVTLAVAAS